MNTALNKTPQSRTGGFVTDCSVLQMFFFNIWYRLFKRQCLQVLQMYFSSQTVLCMPGSEGVEDVVVFVHPDPLQLCQDLTRSHFVQRRLSSLRDDSALITPLLVSLCDLKPDVLRRGGGRGHPNWFAILFKRMVPRLQL